jgi:hypothetical protein
MNREKIAATVVVALFLTFALITASQRYTVTNPWEPYEAAVREYMAAAARGDSTALARASVGAEPVNWMLQAAHLRPSIIAGWSRRLSGGTGERRGDTVAVLLWADDVDGCSRLSSVSAKLLNHSAAPRVLAISSPCIDRPAAHALPW